MKYTHKYYSLNIDYSKGYMPLSHVIFAINDYISERKYIIIDDSDNLSSFNDIIRKYVFVIVRLKDAHKYYTCNRRIFLSIKGIVNEQWDIPIVIYLYP